MTDPIGLLRQRLADNWTATPISWTGVAFDPNNPGGSFPSGGAFIHFDEDTIETHLQAGFGAVRNRERTLGGVMIHIFTPANAGTGLARGYMEDIMDLFRWWQSGGLLARSPSKSSSETDGDWYRISVVIPYQYDELRTKAS